MNVVRPNVLIVEESQLTAELLADILSSQGFETQVALSGHEALQRLTVLPPDAIYVGCDMPDMDRWNLYAQAHKQNGSDSPPMIVAAAGPDIRLAEALSIDTWRLPFDVDELCLRLQYLTRPHWTQSAMAA